MTAGIRISSAGSCFFCFIKVLEIFNNMKMQKNTDFAGVKSVSHPNQQYCLKHILENIVIITKKAKKIAN